MRGNQRAPHQSPIFCSRHAPPAFELARLNQRTSPQHSGWASSTPLSTRAPAPPPALPAHRPFLERASPDGTYATLGSYALSAILGRADLAPTAWRLEGIEPNSPSRQLLDQAWGACLMYIYVYIYIYIYYVIHLFSDPLFFAHGSSLIVWRLLLPFLHPLASTINENELTEGKRFPSCIHLVCY